MRTTERHEVQGFSSERRTLVDEQQENLEGRDRQRHPLASAPCCPGLFNHLKGWGKKTQNCAGKWIPSVLSKTFTLASYGLTFFSGKGVACADAVINAASITTTHLIEHFEHQDEREKLETLKNDFHTLNIKSESRTHPPIPLGFFKSYGITSPQQSDESWWAGGFSLLLSYSSNILLMINNCGKGETDKEDGILKYIALALGAASILFQLADESWKRNNIREEQKRYQDAIKQLQLNHEKALNARIVELESKKDELSNQLTALQNKSGAAQEQSSDLRSFNLLSS